MTPTEFTGWQHHFARRPPGDFMTHRLLARLCAMIESYLSQKVVQPYEAAPWIETPEECAEREGQQREAEDEAAAGRVAAVYRREPPDG